MGAQFFQFRMTDDDPLDGQIIDWLMRSPNRSDCIREALRVYFFLREHGIPVAPVLAEPMETETGTKEAGAESATQPDNPTASEFFQAMRAGLEDWI